METVRHRGSLRLGSVRGIPVRVHWTLALAVPWLGLWFALRLGPGASLGARAAIAGALVVALLVGVVIHELAHALVARRLGAEVRGVTLLFVGGAADLRRVRAGTDEALIAVAGPIVSLAVGAVALAGAVFAPGLAGRALFAFAFVNTAIAAINLLPALPLDGGRLLRGLLAARLGHARATRATRLVGRVLAVALVVAGLFARDPALAAIAILLLFATPPAGERADEDPAERLADVPVGELLRAEATVIDAHESVAEAAARLADTEQRVLLVLLDDRLVGQLPADRVHAVPLAVRNTMPVLSLMVTTAAFADPHEPAGAALQRMRAAGLDRLPVVEGLRLLGVIRREDLLRAAAQHA